MEIHSGLTTLGNAVMILLNNNTLDELRGSGDKCYHKSGECNPKSCVCSSDSNVFKFEMSTSTKIYSFGCIMRYADKNGHPSKIKEIYLSFKDLGKWLITLDLFTFRYFK